MGIFGDLAELRAQEQAAPPAASRRSASTPPEPTADKAARPEPRLLPEPRPPRSQASTPANATVPAPPDLAGLPEALFDLTEHPYLQANFLFVAGELERLDDLKLELRRAHSVAATKNAIVRCALHLLFEDYERNKVKSFAVRRLPKRQ